MARIRVAVAYVAGDGRGTEISLELPAGASVNEAIAASGVCTMFPEIDPARHAVGVHGRIASLDRVLRDHDRVEIYRPLRADPKTARRRRAGQSGGR